MLEVARTFHAAGLRPIPWGDSGGQKIFPPDYAKYRSEYPAEIMEALFNQHKSAMPDIAILCTDGIEAIDVDMKYSLSPTLWDDILEALSSDEEIFAELFGVQNPAYVEKTKSNGYHIVYKTNAPTGNQKLAKRNATEEELKIKPVERLKCIIETRGKGGLLFVAPSENYQAQNGSICNLPTVSDRVREKILNICRSFSEVETETDVFDYEETQPIQKSERSAAKEAYLPPVSPIGQSFSYLTKPGDDYNNRTDLIQLLESYGWKVLGKSGINTRLNRPGAKHSKGVDGCVATINGKQVFKNFSSSEPFDVDKGYTASGVLCILAFSGDWSATVRHLDSTGYGQKVLLQTKPTAVTDDNFDEIINSIFESRWSADKVYRNDCDIFMNTEGVPLPMVAKGGLLGLLGREKSGKSIYMYAIIAAALTGKSYLNIEANITGPIIHFDTEQPEYWWNLGVKNIYKMVGETKNNSRFYAFPMKNYTPKQNRKYMTGLIDKVAQIHGGVGLICLDGSLDICDGFNNEDHATAAVAWMTSTAIKYDCPLIPALHLTKVSREGIGHLGSFLQRKCDATLIFSYKDDLFTCSPHQVRGKRFEAFAFRRKSDGIPELIFDWRLQQRKEEELPPYDPNIRIQGNRNTDQEIPF